MKKKALSVILSVAMLAAPSVPVSASAEEIGFTDGTAIEETVAPEEVDLSGEEADMPKEVPSSEDEVSSIGEAGVQDVEDVENVIEAEGEQTDWTNEKAENGSDEEIFSSEISEENEIDLQLSTIASGECGENVKWKLDTDGTLTISGTGAMKDYGVPTGSISMTSAGPTPWLQTYNNLIRKIVVEEGVTRIGNGAFVCAGITISNYNSTGSVQSVSLPSTLKEIGDSAFWNTGCDSLIVPQNITEAACAFKMARFENVTVNTVHVYKEMFYNSLVDNVILSNNVKEIENNAFENSFIKSIKLSSNLNKIGEESFSGGKLVTVEIPGNVKIIERQAFAGCTSLERVQFSNGIETIGYEAFDGCANLRQVEIPKSVTKIEGETFARCTNLQSAIINANVESMGSCSFLGCTELQTVKLPDTLTNIGNGMFEGCTKLKKLQFPSNLKKIYSSAFGECESLTEITIPAAVEYIATGMGGKLNIFNAFIDCSNLLKINVDAGNKVYSSYEGCLYNKDLTELIYCPMGKGEIVVADTVAKVTNNVFYNRYNNNSKWKDIYFTGDAPTEIGEHLFMDVTATVFVEKDNATWFGKTDKNYSGQITWKEWQPLIDKCEVKLSQEEYTFNGQEQKPSIIVTGGDIVLNENQDYILSYNNNINAGSAMVTIAGKGKYGGRKTVNFTIRKAEQELTVNVSKTSLQIGEIIPITASAMGEISYLSNSDDVVSVDGNGYITGKKAGTAVINIIAAENTNYKSIKKELLITVKNECKDNMHKWGNSVIIQMPACTTNGVEIYTCTACQKTKTEIIPAAGHKYGDYTVTKEPTIFASGTESRECAVCHNKEEEEIPKLTAEVELVSKTLPMQVKKSILGKQLVADKDPSDSIASLETTNEKVVAVNNKNFKITAKKTGKVVITVTMKSGATSRITVSVKKGKVAATKITGIKRVLTIKKGKKLTLKPVLSPITSTDDLTYSSTNEDIASVSSKGVIKALKRGKARIKIKAGKKTVTCVVTVK